MSGHDRKGYISVWLGKTPNDIHKFNSYFENYDNSVAISPVRQDLEVDWIDDDLFAVYYSDGGSLLPVEQVINEIPFSECFRNEIIAECKSLGINEANAYFSLIDFEFKDEGKLKKAYGDLYFVGAYPYSSDGLDEEVRSILSF